MHSHTKLDGSSDQYLEQLQHYVQNGQLIGPDQDIYPLSQIKCESPGQLKQIMKQRIINLHKRSQKQLKDTSRVSKSHSLKQGLTLINSKLTHQLQDSKMAKQQPYNMNFILKKPSPQKMIQQRFTSFKNYIAKNIQTLEGQCQKLYGGAQFIMGQLNKHQISKQDLAQYYAKMVSKNFSLPKLKSNSTLSTRVHLKQKQDKYIYKKNTQPLQKKQGKVVNLKAQSQSIQNRIKLQKERNAKYVNKWYINPNERFKIDKKDTQYDWRRQDGILNVIKSRNKTISNRYKFLPNLVQEVKKKHQRDPIFCKYTAIQ